MFLIGSLEDLPIRAQHVGLADFPWVEGVGASGLMEYQKASMQDAIIFVVTPFSLCDLMPSDYGPERFGEVERRSIGRWTQGAVGFRHFIHGFSFFVGAGNVIRDLALSRTRISIMAV